MLSLRSESFLFFEKEKSIKMEEPLLWLSRKGIDSSELEFWAYDDYYELQDFYPIKAFNEKRMKDRHPPFAYSYSL